MRHDLDSEHFTFMIDYPYEGGTRTAYIVATDLEDAHAQLSALQAFGHIEGQLIESDDIHAPTLN